LRETVAEVADAGYDEFLGTQLHQRTSTGVSCRGAEEAYLCGGHVGGRLDPDDRVADLLNGVDKRADVARDIVEHVDGRHGGRAGAGRSVWSE
jgi:hypothetical protein